MGFYESTVQFNGKRVVNFDPEQGIQDDTVAYRFYTNYDVEHDVPENFRAFLQDPKAPKVDTLVFGLVAEEAEMPPTEIIQLIVEHQDRLQQVTGLFFGDIVQEEAEVSWIEQCDHSPVWKALPNLKVYRVRGGNELSFSQPEHAQLKKLIIETGGLFSETLQNIAEAQLPELEHLELWLGSEDYGFNATPEEILAAVQGPNGDRFPKLQYLGLLNCEVADDLAVALEGASILERIQVLDLSEGNLGDKGAEALMDNPAIKNLSQLIFDHHYVSEESVERLRDLGLQVSAEDRQEPDDYGDGEVHYYIAVSE